MHDRNTAFGPHQIPVLGALFRSKDFIRNRSRTGGGVALIWRDRSPANGCRGLTTISTRPAMARDTSSARSIAFTARWKQNCRRSLQRRRRLYLQVSGDRSTYSVRGFCRFPPDSSSPCRWLFLRVREPPARHRGRLYQLITAPITRSRLPSGEQVRYSRSHRPTRS